MTGSSMQAVARVPLPYTACPSLEISGCVMCSHKNMDSAYKCLLMEAYDVVQRTQKDETGLLP